MSLWRWEVHLRGCTLSGLFVAEDSDVQAAVGKKVYLGEVAGKHSEVELQVEAKDFTKLDARDSDVADMALVLGETWCGINPLEVIAERQAEEES